MDDIQKIDEERMDVLEKEVDRMQGHFDERASKLEESDDDSMKHMKEV